MRIHKRSPEGEIIRSLCLLYSILFLFTQSQPFWAIVILFIGSQHIKYNAISSFPQIGLIVAYNVDPKDKTTKKWNCSSYHQNDFMFKRKCPENMLARIDTILFDRNTTHGVSPPDLVKTLKFSYQIHLYQSLPMHELYRSRILSGNNQKLREFSFY